MQKKDEKEEINVKEKAWGFFWGGVLRTIQAHVRRIEKKEEESVSEWILVFCPQVT